MADSIDVVGRYAPSPTGDLHLGNLRTALLAWLHARLQGGKFILRMEDIDLPRVVPGSADQILRDLEWLGLDWDGPVVYQSRRTELYQAALDALSAQHLSYPCFCSRKDIRLASSAPHGQAAIYPATCRGLTEQDVDKLSRRKSPAVRIKVPRLMASEVGDFVIKRSDALIAYQLAVTVDDLDQGVSEVLRGEDLKSSTVKQRYLASLLKPDCTEIVYLHAPLMLDQSGQRMSKRDGSSSIRSWQKSGKSAEQLITYLASTLGLLPCNEPISLMELIGIIDKSAIDAKLS